MHGRDTREDVDAYGIWPWVAGVLAAALLTYLTFAFAAPIGG